MLSFIAKVNLHWKIGIYIYIYICAFLFFKCLCRSFLVFVRNDNWIIKFLLALLNCEKQQVDRCSYYVFVRDITTSSSPSFML